MYFSYLIHLRLSINTTILCFAYLISHVWLFAIIIKFILIKYEDFTELEKTECYNKSKIKYHSLRKVGSQTQKIILKPYIYMQTINFIRIQGENMKHSQNLLEKIISGRFNCKLSGINIEMGQLKNEIQF